MGKNEKNKYKEIMFSFSNDLRKMKYVLIITSAIVIINLLIWIFLMNFSFSTEYGDELHYISIARTFYLDKSVWNDFSYGYFVHLPFFPLFIRLFSFIGYENSYVFVIFLFYFLNNITFYYIIKENEIENINLTMYLNIGIVFTSVMLLTLRATLVALFFTQLAYIYFKRKNYVLSAVFIGISSITHIFSCLFIVIFFIVTLIQEKSFRRKITNGIKFGIISIIPIMLLFSYFWLISGDFLIFITQQSEYGNTQFIIFRGFIDIVLNQSISLIQKSIVVLINILIICLVFIYFKKYTKIMKERNKNDSNLNLEITLIVVNLFSLGFYFALSMHLRFLLNFSFLISIIIIKFKKEIFNEKVFIWIIIIYATMMILLGIYYLL